MPVQFIYTYPLLINMIVGVLMFVGPMSAAENNSSLTMISLMITGYGLGYILFSLLMGKIIRTHLAKYQIIGGTLFISLLCLILGAVNNPIWMIVIYSILPFGASLFFNAFQALMKDVHDLTARPISWSVSSYIASLTFGFAFGPLLSGWLREISSWNTAYFFASGIAFFVAVCAMFCSPVKSDKKENFVDYSYAKKPDLSISGWAGSLTGFLILSLFLTIFPRQSEQMELRPLIKGLVIFLLNIVQPVYVQLYARHHNWVYRHTVAPFINLLGIVALLSFYFARNTFGLYAGAVLFGMFLSTTAFTAIFHSLSHPVKSVRYIAVNEAFVGTGFLLGPQLIHIKPATADFTFSYFVALFLVVFLILFQFIYIKNKTQSNGKLS
ncbi:MFS transporter [candidate division KSB1 bacterium]|nr:MFS transporter [candidate division KSB1 bacterium]